MIDFKPVSFDDRELYEHYIMDENERGCEFTFANLYMWGQQNITVLHNHIVLFSWFNNRNVYPYPIGKGNKKVVLDAIIEDAKERKIPCQITGLGATAKQTLEELYPGKFRFYCNRDAFDYVYAIDDLADLNGRKYHGKRNHYNRFRNNLPNYTVEPIRKDNLPRVRQMIDKWYAVRLQKKPDDDYHMEQIALEKALGYYRELGMEGLMLLNGEDILAVTLGSRMSVNSFDVHFEKARQDVEGAYTAINCEFARYIRNKYPQIKFLNREEDMGLEGLRKSKLSYHPHHMVEKCWAFLLEDGYEY